MANRKKKSSILDFLSKRPIILFALILIIASSLLIGQSLFKTSPKIYENGEFSIRVTYPSSWGDPIINENYFHQGEKKDLGLAAEFENKKKETFFTLMNFNDLDSRYDYFKDTFENRMSTIYSTRKIDKNVPVADSVFSAIANYTDISYIESSNGKYRGAYYFILATQGESSPYLTRLELIVTDGDGNIFWLERRYQGETYDKKVSCIRVVPDSKIYLEERKTESSECNINSSMLNELEAYKAVVASLSTYAPEVVSHDRVIPEREEVIENVYSESSNQYYTFVVDLKTDNFARGQWLWGPTGTAGVIKKTNDGWILLRDLQNWIPCQQLRDFGMTDQEMEALQLNEEGTLDGITYCQ